MSGTSDQLVNAAASSSDRAEGKGASPGHPSGSRPASVMASGGYASASSRRWCRTDLAALPAVIVAMCSRMPTSSALVSARPEVRHGAVASQFSSSRSPAQASRRCWYAAVSKSIVEGCSSPSRDPLAVETSSVTGVLNRVWPFGACEFPPVAGTTESSDLAVPELDSAPAPSLPRREAARSSASRGGTEPQTGGPTSTNANAR